MDPFPQMNLIFSPDIKIATVLKEAGKQGIEAAVKLSFDYLFEEAEATKQQPSDKAGYRRDDHERAYQSRFGPRAPSYGCG